VTKGLQEIHLDKHIRLLDSPGIVFASGEGAAAAALRNAIKVSMGLCVGVMCVGGEGGASWLVGAVSRGCATPSRSAWGVWLVVWLYVWGGGGARQASELEKSRWGNGKSRWGELVGRVCGSSQEGEAGQSDGRLLRGVCGWVVGWRGGGTSENNGCSTGLVDLWCLAVS